MCRLSRILCMLLACVSLAFPVQGVAQRADEQEGRALFEQGIRAAEQERWADALELFRRARAIARRPSVLYNEAQMLVRLSRFAEARRALRDYLSLVRGSTDEAELARMERARELLHEVEGRLATLVLMVSPSDATVEVDGQPVEGQGARRRLEVDPGRHVVTVRADGYEPRTATYSLLSGSSAEESVRLGSSESTRLIVETDDPDARIEVDGERAGRGRASVAVEPGEHVVRVTPSEGDAYERTVDVDAGETFRLDARPGGGGSVTEQAWFWAIVGVVVAGAVVGGVVAATYDPGVQAPVPGDIGPGGVIEALRF